jgi:uncharacterized coiled-coil DUF342 family protein
MKTPEEIKQASSQYADLIKHMDDLHTEACQLDFQAGANWMKDQSTSQIEDLTKENEELSKENDDLHNSLLQRTDQNIDLTKEVESKKESIRILMKQLDTQQESNDRYREALEEKAEQLKYCHGRMAEAYKEATDAQQTKNDLTGCTQLLNEMFKWAKVKDGRAIFETSEETWNGYKKFVSAIHPLVKEGE